MAATPALYDRNEIHKSCRTIESLVNILSDYAEAASAIISLQKKLAKALREAAGLKSSGNVPCNAFNACASIFETLADVDAKHAKIADREAEAITAELRKWFKKLSREERAHDEKIATANAKIKAAGQAYEKKQKKGARDVSEEHARYINLISTLGPEINEDKYNHSLSVSTKHTEAMYLVAAALSRVTDTEWIRVWECVKKFTPSVGLLAQWRALCEGGYQGPLPTDLPDIDFPTQQLSPAPSAPSPHLIQAERPPQLTTSLSSESQSKSSVSDQDLRIAPPIPTRSNSRTETQSSQDSPRPPHAAPSAAKWDDSVTSVVSLSAFPTPPTSVPVAILPSLTEQPFAEIEPEHVLNRSPSRIRRSSLNIPETYIPPATNAATVPFIERSAGPSRQTNVDEMGAIREAVERKASVTSGAGHVAAMRTKYINGSTSPPPLTRTELPRPPVSVSDLAYRYNPTESPTRPNTQPSPSYSPRSEQREREQEVRYRALDKLATSSSPDLASKRKTSFQSPSSSSGQDHASSCGCATCSVAHYSRPPSGINLVPSHVQLKEKKPGWIRRLSMPVGNAFSSSSDSPKRTPTMLYSKPVESPLYSHSKTGSRSVTDLALGIVRR